MNAIITRRTAIGGATIGTMVIASPGLGASPHVSSGLAAALEKYHAADYHQSRFLQDMFDPAEDAWQQAGEAVSRSTATDGDTSAVAAHLAALRRLDALELRRDELVDLASQAAGVVISYPVASLQDLQAKLEFLADED